jgi:hypothetical protein
VLADDDDVVRVEEDWELVVATPDPGSVGPQVTCILSPVAHVDAIFVAVEVNHQSSPSFVPGGVQLQVWSGESLLNTRKFPNSAVMSTTGETVRWTTSMQMDGDNVNFAVVNGTSSTWGNFGGQGYLTATVDAGVSNLNGYSTDVSVANSGPGYAGNRVQSLVLKRVRRHLSNGQVQLDDTPRVVHQLE